MTTHLSKVVLITGASSGIGKAAAKAFAADGWQVIATMRSPERERELQEIRGISVQKLDVTDNDSITAVIEQVESTYGRLDVLVNNAGYGLMGAFEDSSHEQIERQFSTNVFGVMNMSRAVLPLMRRVGSGRIINISSIGGRLGIPLYSSYHATKFAVEGFSESLAFELKPFGIDVVLIEPGAIATEFLGRSADLASPEGKSPYKAYFERVLSTYIRESSRGATPELVAQKILKAGRARSPRARYPAGGGAGSLLALRKILPDCAVSSLVKMQSGG